MKKYIAVLLAVALMATAFAALNFSASAAAMTNLLTGADSTFEESTLPSGWTAFGYATSVTLATDKGHSGSNSILVPNRPFDYSSAQYNIYSLLKANGAGTYAIGMWVLVDSLPATGTITGPHMLVRDTTISLTSAYFPITANTWTFCGGTITVTAADLTAATGTISLMIDSLSQVSGQNLYIDDVQIYKMPSDNVINGTFEASMDLLGWNTFNNGALSLSTAEYHSGSASLKYNKDSQYASATTDVTAILAANGAGYYTVSFWGKLDASAASETAAFVPYFTSSGNSHKNINSGFSFNKTTWSQVSSVVQMSADDIATYTNYTTTACNTFLRLGSDTFTGIYYLDDVTISYSATDPSATAVPTEAPTQAPTVAPTDAPAATATAVPTATATAKPSDGNIFVAGNMEGENALDGWGRVSEGASAGLSLSTDVFHGGSQSLKESGRGFGFASPYYNIYDSIKANGAGTYTIKVWAYADGLTADASADLLIRGLGAADENSFITANGDNYYAKLVSGVTVSDKTWTQFTAQLTVTESDIAAATGNFNLCLDGITAEADLYLDDIMVIDPSQISGTTKDPESTADFMTLGYAIAAVSGLGALAISKKRRDS